MESLSLYTTSKRIKKATYLIVYYTYIKNIDCDFIEKINNPKYETLVKAMSKTLGIQVVAEGVGNLKQARFLRRPQSKILQDYLFSKALNSKIRTDFLQKRKHSLF